MKKRRPRRLSRTGSDTAYLARVRTLPCHVQPLAAFDPLFVFQSTCRGRVHAHHAIHRSQGGKDSDAIPLCERHHQQWHDANGVFAGLSKLERFAWSQRAIAVTRAALGGGG